MDERDVDVALWSHVSAPVATDGDQRRSVGQANVVGERSDPLVQTVGPCICERRAGERVIVVKIVSTKLHVHIQADASGGR